MPTPGEPVDTTGAILLLAVDAQTVDAYDGDVPLGPAAYLVLGGRLADDPDGRRTCAGYLFGADGLAAIVSQLLGVSGRFKQDLFHDLTRRLTDLTRSDDLDVAWLRAVVERVVIDATTETSP